MARVANVETYEIDANEQNWMIQLGKLGRVASRITLKNVPPTSSNIAFVKAISAENHLFIRSWEQDLVLERMAGWTSAIPQAQTMEPSVARSASQ